MSPLVVFLLLPFCGIVLSGPLKNPGMVVDVIAPPDHQIAPEDDDKDSEAIPAHGADSNTNTDETDEDFVIPRPQPGLDDISDEENEDPAPAIERLKIEGIDFGNERVVRDVQGGYDDGDDDTVVVNAASCDDLRKACNDNHDFASCHAYNENCNGDEGDESQVGSLIDW